jgi:hypothetical protein
MKKKKGDIYEALVLLKLVRLWLLWKEIDIEYSKLEKRIKELECEK